MKNAFHFSTLCLLCLSLLCSANSRAATVTYPFNFFTGWNLAGNSLSTPINVTATFGGQTGVATVWKWNAATGTWAFYAPSLDTNGTLASYAAGKGYSVLTTINAGEGYWVNATTPLSFGNQSGTGQSLTAGSLATGWNLSATGDAVTPAAFSTTIGNVTTLWAWDNASSKWYFHAPNLATNNLLASYINSKGYLDFGNGTLDNGRGFWVNTRGWAPSSGGTLLGKLSGDFRINNFGWRPIDRKIAVMLGHGNASVQLLRTSDNSIAAAYTASAVQTESSYSGDQYSVVDFTNFNTPGDYYLYLPSANIRSYGFKIANNVYNIAGAAAVKSYYYQRCNHDKVLPYASDALGGYPGLGGQWVDPGGLCHATDLAASPGPNSANQGVLKVNGGWHDAGDYQKTLWDRGVPAMLFAYEMNPTVWTDGQLNIPESGNGVPDLLDEAQWELDFYTRMQLPDGHFMSSVQGNIVDGVTIASPPSASNEGRAYFDCTSPVGGGWSTSTSVTLAEATGNAVLSLAHAAIVFRAIGQAALGNKYATAATNGWNWLNNPVLNSQAVTYCTALHTMPDGSVLNSPVLKGQVTLTVDETRLKAAAAAAVFRMDPTIVTAKDYADKFEWDTWGGLIPGGMASPADAVIATGAWHYLMNASGTASVKTKIRTGVAAAIVDNAFNADGPYGGLLFNPAAVNDWNWGSSRAQSYYGFNLLMAVKQGVLGSHTADQITLLAQKHLHFLLGLNPLNMVYLSNMAAYGGSHSMFQLYHMWFSYTGISGGGNGSYNGRPTWVNEPLWPYYVADTQTSQYGPPPGFLSGGPNWYYTGSGMGAIPGSGTLPKTNWPAYAYRDFSIGSSPTAPVWELSEPQQAYQGAFVGLVSFLMSTP